MANNKGLLNNPGENNCFLNSAVQVLWHLDVFRRSFREIKGHYCMGESCIFCALDLIFKQFQYSSNDALPPDGLRVALAAAFKNQHRFQLGDMDDAAECFENILSHMHTLVTKNEYDDACNVKHCISHQKFAMQVIEQTICECGEQSEPLPFFQLVHYVSASALCAKARRLKGWDSTRPIENPFGYLLRRAGQDTRECQSPDCNEKVQVQRLLLNCPDIVSVGLIWDSECPDAEHIADVLQCIGTTLKLSDLYHQVYDEKAKDACLQLVGIVTYYGKHYSTFFFHSKLRTWIYFDDARVKEIGSDWLVMMEKCRLCHYQPLLLLYANPIGTPVNADSAPKERILINGSVHEKGSEGKQSVKGLNTERGTADGVSDCEKSPVMSKKSKSRNKPKLDKKSLFRSKKSLSSGDLSIPKKELTRSPSNASDSTTNSPGKERHRPSFKRIGTAIMSAMNPALAVSHLKQNKKKGSSKSRRSSTGSSESSGDPDLIDLSPKNEEAKMEILKLYEQSKALHSAQARAMNNDSGISSTPSSAGGSVSSTDTNHGGSDEDLIDFNQSWRRSQYDNWPPPPAYTADRIEKLIKEGQLYLQLSQEWEDQKDLVKAFDYCTHAATMFRTVTEDNSVDLNRKNYAQMKRNVCHARAKNLNHVLQSSQTTDNGTASVSLSRQKEEELLRQQRQREQYIIRQQQQQQQQKQQKQQQQHQQMPQQLQPPPVQYMSVQRRDRPVREYSSAQVTARSVQEVPVSSSNGSYVDSRFNRKDNWEERNAASLPLKTKPTVYSSGHYVSKPQGNKTGSSGMGPGVCSQQIKPDYLCYNPVHYERERESEIAARIQNVDIRAPSPEPRTDHTKVIPVGVNRTRTSENRRPPPPTRRVSSSIYISPSNPSNLRASTVDTYDPKTYQSSDSPKAPPSISISRPRHKVSYVGNLAQNSRPTTRDRSPSPARSADGMDSDYRARGSYGPRPAQYVPAPPYNPPHQREHLKSYSTSSLSRPWFQSGSTDDSYTNTSRDLRQVPARVITDRPVCEKCRCVPIDRRQRLCAGCEQELYQIHSNTARLY